MQEKEAKLELREIEDRNTTVQDDLSYLQSHNRPTEANDLGDSGILTAMEPFCLLNRTLKGHLEACESIAT